MCSGELQTPVRDRFRVRFRDRVGFRDRVRSEPCEDRPPLDRGQRPRDRRPAFQRSEPCEDRPPLDRGQRPRHRRPAFQRSEPCEDRPPSDRGQRPRNRRPGGTHTSGTASSAYPSPHLDPRFGCLLPMARCRIPGLRIFWGRSTRSGPSAGGLQGGDRYRDGNGFEPGKGHTPRVP